jgi:hypothetical protein
MENNENQSKNKDINRPGRGGWRGGGRPKGSKSRVRKLLEAKQIPEGGDDAMTFLVSVFKDQNQKISDRIDAAGKVLPYTHRKQPTDINHSGQVDVPAPTVIVEMVVPDEQE